MKMIKINIYFSISKDLFNIFCKDFICYFCITISLGNLKGLLINRELVYLASITFLWHFCSGNLNLPNLNSANQFMESVELREIDLYNLLSIIVQVDESLVAVKALYKAYCFACFWFVNDYNSKLSNEYTALMYLFWYSCKKICIMF